MAALHNVLFFSYYDNKFNCNMKFFIWIAIILNSIMSVISLLEISKFPVTRRPIVCYIIVYHSKSWYIIIMVYQSCTLIIISDQVSQCTASGKSKIMTVVWNLYDGGSGSVSYDDSWSV